MSTTNLLTQLFRDEHGATAVEYGLILAMIVAIRTFLSWSLALELEGRWPWQRASD